MGHLIVAFPQLIQIIRLLDRFKTQVERGFYQTKDRGIEGRLISPALQFFGFLDQILNKIIQFFS